MKPGGIVVASTINRTLKAFALAIVGAEYVLRWLPQGTHSYDKLVTPAELAAAFRAAGLAPADETGVMYMPVADRWRLTSDTDVNYMMTASSAGLTVTARPWRRHTGGNDALPFDRRDASRRVPLRPR